MEASKKERAFSNSSRNKLLNRSSYNKIADKWQIARQNGSISSLLVLFANKLKEGSSVLDIGCGTGRPVTKFLSEKNFVITAIDISDKMIQKAQSLNLKNANFIVCDFFDFKPNVKFDGVVAFDSFFHFPKDEQKNIYTLVGKMLKKDGYLLFTHGKYNIEIIDKMFDQEFYYSSLEIKEVKILLEEAGFEIVKLIEDYKEASDARELVVLAKKILN